MYNGYLHANVNIVRSDSIQTRSKVRCTSAAYIGFNAINGSFKLPLNFVYINSPIYDIHNAV